VLDISGGARILIFGPYIHLPPSLWTAQVWLGLSAEASGHKFLIEVYSGEQLAAASLQPAAGGIFAVDLNFSLDEPNAEGLEIRIIVTDDNAKGRLAFGEVVLTPVGTRSSEIATEWAQKAKAMLDL